MGDRAFAEQLFNKALAIVNDKTYTVNPTLAYQQMAAACHADPMFGLAWYTIGAANSDLNKVHASIACYHRALECVNDDKQKAKIYCNLGWRLHTLSRTKEAYDYLALARDLDPDLYLTYLNLSLVYGTLGLPEKAVEAARIAYGMQDEAQTEMALAFALLFNRQFAEGFKHFERRYEYKLQHFVNYPYPKWTGARQTILLMADQGLGDTLSFARFIRMACERAKFVHLCVQPGLIRLFQHAFLDVKNLNLIPLNTAFPMAEAWTTIVSLPHVLGLTDDEIRNTPQIAPVIYSLPRTWKLPDRNLHIGIAWRGSDLNDINVHRSIPLQNFLDLYRVPGIQLYSLQVDQKKKELFDIGAMALVSDLSNYISDVCDTVTLMQDLDLIITCESALGHIAALAGKECWIPYSYAGRDYRIGLDGKDMLWTPHHRIFPQGQDLDWKPVFQRMCDALQERV